ncbi:carbohydrate kinase [Marinomonas mediterranea]|uniref:carbohydrate kinase n=1 Tax=Marinomonas mediterranea TaxID=119864 RepID=UPI002349B46D|nr:carbohydrate kinase [Marinomonas mediterranea]
MDTAQATMTDQESTVLEAIRQDPLASQQTLANRIGMSRESLAGHIMRLTRQGYILGKGYMLASENPFVVIGGANIDINGRSSNALKMSDSNPGFVSQSPGGVGRNIAENLARLGENVHLVALIGEDQNGEWINERTRDAGVNTQDLIRHEQLPTSTYLAINNEVGELNAAIADMRIVDQLSPERLQTKMPLLQSAGHIILDANLSEDTIRWLATLTLKTTWCADAVSATKAIRLRPILSKLSVLKVNQDEARAILDSDEQDQTKLAKLLLEQGVQQVLLSLGNQGVLYASEHTCFSQTCLPSSPVSDSGAGDALIAGFLHARQQDHSIEKSLHFAAACAALTLESEDANHPHLTNEHVNHWIESL